MTTNAYSPPREKLRLKEPTGWFAAGSGFQRAITELSDGAFKLFAYLCLQAERPTGRLETTQRQLAVVLRKSKRIIGSYVDELHRKGICAVFRGQNQYAPTRFRIGDDYWPYHRPEEDRGDPRAHDPSEYIAAIREMFLGLACGIGKFGPADVRAAQRMHQDEVPLGVVLDAMLLGSCRKYISWENGATVPVQVIGSFAYFKPLIEEVQEQPFTDDYREYLRRKNVQLAESWRDRSPCGEKPREGGYPNMAPSEIVL